MTKMFSLSGRDRFSFVASNSHSQGSKDWLGDLEEMFDALIEKV
jgi:hypothetical protein